MKQTFSWKNGPETLEGFQSSRWCFALNSTQDNSPRIFKFVSLFLKIQASFVLFCALFERLYDNFFLFF